jgi:hypothetical protein
MSFGTWRKRLWTRGLSAFLALLVCGASLGWGHVGGDDPDCDAIPIVHDHSAHRISGQTSPASSPEGHCFICHTLRLLHMTRRARAARLAPPSSVTAAVQRFLPATRFGFVATGISRGPPALPTA